MGCELRRIINNCCGTDSDSGAESGSRPPPSRRSQSGTATSDPRIPTSRPNAGQTRQTASLCENTSSASLSEQLTKFVDAIDLSSTRLQHFASAQEIADPRIRLLGQVTAAFEQRFSEKQRLSPKTVVLPNAYEHPHGIDTKTRGNVSLYFDKNLPQNGEILFCSHGMGEPGAAYKPSAFQTPGVRYARPNSRGDEALYKGFHVGVISLKGDINDSPLIASNTQLRDAVVNAVKSYQAYIVEELGEEFKAEKIILMGKSRGTKAVLSALAELHRQGIPVSSAILEAPILNAAALKLERAQEIFKNEHDLYSIAKKATSKLKNDFIQNHSPQ